MKKMCTCDQCQMCISRKMQLMYITINKVYTIKFCCNDKMMSGHPLLKQFMKLNMLNKDSALQLHALLLYDRLP